MCTRSQVRTLGVLLSKHTHTHKHSSHGGRGEKKEGGEGGGAERRQVRPLFSLTAVGEISLFLTGK